MMLKSSKPSRAGGDGDYDDGDGDDPHISIEAPTQSKESESKKPGAQKRRTTRRGAGVTSDDALTQSMKYAKDAPQEHTDQWHEMFQELCDFKRFTGNCLVPSTFVNSKLSSWVKMQRHRYKKKKDSRYTNSFSSRLIALTQEEESRLKSVDFVFDASEFKGKRRDDGDGRKDYLAYWESKKNKAREDESDSNDDGDSVEEMSEVGKDWFVMYKELCRYESKFGDCRVKTSYHGDQTRHLGNWVKAQRKKYRAKKLSEKEISLLNNIEFIWYGKKYENVRQKNEKS